MNKKVFGYIILCFLSTSCENLMFKGKLPSILGIEQVKVENAKSVDDFGGFGEGKTIEIYTLSELTVKSFVLTSNKILRDKDNYLKKDWTKNVHDAEMECLISYSLNYRGGNTIEVQLKNIKEILSQPNIYVAFYHNERDTCLSNMIQMFVLDITNKMLYIVDTVI